MKKITTQTKLLALLLIIISGLAIYGQNQLSKQQIDNLTYESTEGAEQITIVGRGVTSPQTSNAYSSEQIANLTYNATNGANQVYVNESSAQDFLGDNLNALATPTPNAVIYSDSSGEYGFVPLGDSGKILTSNGTTSAPSWEISNDFATYINITGTSPYLQTLNTETEDIDGGRESTQYFKGYKSGGEASTLVTVTGQHSGTGDDDKGQLVFQPTEDATDFIEIQNAAGTPIVTVDAVNVEMDVDGNIELVDNADILKVNGTQVLYLPDQTAFLGSMILGDEGANLSHVAGVEGQYNLFAGIGAGAALTDGARNTLLGADAGSNLASANNNVALGSKSLELGVTASYNVCLGTSSCSRITGDHNFGLGNNALFWGTSGDHTIAIGASALQAEGSGGAVLNNNVAIGSYVGYVAATGSDGNVLIGYQSGYNLAGDANIFLGYQSGFNETGSNKLYIENSNSASPLIYGEFDNDLVKVYGTLQGDRNVIADADGIVLTSAQMGSYILMTGAGEVQFPDTCDSATGSWVRVINKTNTNQVELVVTDGSDAFVLVDGTVLTAGNEADLATGPSDWAEVTCLETNTWYILESEGTVTDGGAAD